MSFLPIRPDASVHARGGAVQDHPPRRARRFRISGGSASAIHDSSCRSSSSRTCCGICSVAATATAVFLDADILVAGLASSRCSTKPAAHAIALTPHLLDPLSAVHRSARELNILQSGVYNGGFIGVSPRDPARQFLGWWADRLHTHCRHDIAAGMHYDQRWLDLVPALFDDVHVVRDAGCNVALLERARTGFAADAERLPGGHQSLPVLPLQWLRTGTSGDSDALLRPPEDGEPSGPRPLSLRALRRSAPRAGATSSAGSGRIRSARSTTARRSRWSPGACTQEMGDAVDQFDDPFETRGSHSYYRWLNEPVEPPAGSSGTMTRLWDAVYRSRPDVQQAFPDVFAADHAGFQEWIGTSGLREHDVSEAFAPRKRATCNVLRCYVPRTCYVRCASCHVPRAECPTCHVLGSGGRGLQHVAQHVARISTWHPARST